MEGPAAEYRPALPADVVPDLMNDPQFATNHENGDDGNGDPDTCRICRGDATDQEPLFYPCKCSGSIKFVHQDCLMEWLSHSQKKHCELCKTPFRFTKLYASNMPSTLPMHVFIRHLIVHTIKNTALSLRICLVVFVWLGCLPFMMRHIWGFLFWLGDGGWTSYGEGAGSGTSQATVQALALAQTHLANLAANGTSPASPLLADATSSATPWMIMQQLPAIFRTTSETLDMNSSEPLLFSFIKTLLYGFGAPEESSGNASFSREKTSQASESHFVGSMQGSSLLSEVSFLRNFTRSPSVNSFIIATLEGQVITIIVVVCFILVFLIREWVVQQQPGINMGAGFDAEFIAGDRGGRNRNVLPEPEPELFRPVAEPEADMDHHALVGRERNEIDARPIARARRRHQPHVRFEDDRENQRDTGIATRRASFQSEDGSWATPRDENRIPAGTNQKSKPAIPAQDARSPVAEIQRHLTEEASNLFQDRLDAGEFVLIWRRAGGSPEEVLRIIEAENLGDKLRYWKNAMLALQQAQPKAGQGSDNDSHLKSQSPDHIVSDRPEHQSAEDANTSDEGWYDVAESVRSGQQQLASQSPYEEKSSSHKGKEKMRGYPSVQALIDAGPAPNPSLHHWVPKSPQEASDINFQFDSLLTASSSSRLRSEQSEDATLQGKLPIPEGSNRSAFHGSRQTQESVKSEPTSSISVHDQSWRSAQDLRVQQAITKGRQLQQIERELQEVQQKLNPSACEQEPEGSITLVKRNGEEFAANSWDDIFANNPVSSDSEEEDVEEGSSGSPAIVNNPFHPDGLLPDDTPLREIIELPRAPRDLPEGIFGHIAEWLWGDMEVDNEDAPRDDEHIVQDIAAEAPFVPVAHHGQFENDLNIEEDQNPDAQQEVLFAALAAGIDPNDPDGLDDAEDFEGIMELVGMRGPLIGLVQNGLFSAVLISLTVACGVWIPYNIGRLALLLLAKPLPIFKAILKMIFSCAAFMQDLALVVILTTAFLVIKTFSFFQAFTQNIETVQSAPAPGTGLAMDCLRLSIAASKRIANGFIGTLTQIPESEVPAFSASSHEALLHVQETIRNALHFISSIFTSRFTPLAGVTVTPSAPFSISNMLAMGKELAGNTLQYMSALPARVTESGWWVMSLEIPARTTPLDLALSNWSGTDRFWAILSGYIAFSLLGALYLKKGTPFSSSQAGREWEAIIIDILHQAGGVMKVILIISIEMLVFPLYCGLLLDLALLPLFQNATILSRILFTIENPLTSIFVHWFVGTCYMFHFALFVSMCRKIMRSGVLYFIRDPDDPTFHPVRDVLERNVSTQLRKITFSAMVYGALVVICLGGVVWTLAFAFESVLPIHWSSNEPVLEFPIDLLFYNFFMPLAAKFFKPSDGLYAMYAWWFRKCARILRLTWFLFDERMMDEEGHHVRRRWADLIWGTKGDVARPVKPEEQPTPLDHDDEINAYFRQDGKYVRTPASDQVRISKGHKVFLEVDEENNRLDGKADSDDGLHGRNSDHFKMVYIPPYFRGRIFIFMLSIWFFAAVTGVCITVVPLVLGRQIFARLIPTHVQKNDVYAFSIGVYILGSALYCLFHAREGIDYLRNALKVDAQTPKKLLRRTTSVTKRLLHLTYAYAAFALLLPTLFSMVIEFYIIVPLHTYFAPGESHTIHFVQSWTLGLLYVKLTSRFILWYSDSRPAEALRAVTRNGYLDPDVRIATRCFILPATVLLSIALGIPLFLAWVVNNYTSLGDTTIQAMIVYRYAYPLCLCAFITGMAVWAMMGIMKGWRMKIRDEVYLIGERLHNFGDRSKSGAGALMPQRSRIET